MTQIISVMRYRAQISRVRRDWHNSVMHHFYHLKLEAETLKIIIIINFLPFFLVPRTLISSDQIIIGYLLM